MRHLALIAVMALAACESGPRLGANIGIDSGGVSVNPAVSGRVGGVGVTVTP